MRDIDTTLKVIAIDHEIYQMIKHNDVYIYAVYQNSLHLCLNDLLITVGARIYEGKHHIVLNKNIAFRDLNLKMKQKACIKDDHLFLGDLKLDIDYMAVKNYQSYDLTYLKTDNLDVVINQLLGKINLIIKEEMLIKYSSAIMKIVLNRINQFLEKPNLGHARLILGLGQGLTPYGDDILVGYIMGRNTIGYPIEWIESLLDAVDEKTTRLSAQNIKDTYKRIYPHIYVEMIEELFNKNKTEHAIELMNIGDTSGVGMLLGFLYGIKAGEEYNERL